MEDKEYMPFKVKDFTANLNFRHDQLISAPLRGCQWGIILNAMSMLVTKLAYQEDLEVSAIIMMTEHKLLERLDPETARKLLAHVEEIGKEEG